MKIEKCNSYGGVCPCVFCVNNCCAEMGQTDTEKLCDIAREYCEKYIQRQITI